MLSELLNGPRAIGLKQSQRAVKEGKALGAWVAEDAEPHVIRPFLALCQQHGVPGVSRGFHGGAGGGLRHRRGRRRSGVAAAIKRSVRSIVYCGFFPGRGKTAPAYGWNKAIICKEVRYAYI